VNIYNHSKFRFRTYCVICFREWRLDNENASLKANCNHLSENLEATMRELTQLKHESSLRMTDLEISLVESKTEVCKKNI